MTCEDRDLKYLQSLPLNEKIQKTKERIIEWYESFDGKVYVSFSGGKDSTVLLDIARKLYPDIEAVFADTGLSYPEIRDFVKTFDNVTWVRPKISFKEVIEKYGWPIVSKEQSRFIYDVRHSTPYMKNMRLTGEKKCGRINTVGILSKRWRYLVDAPFKIGNKCCDVMKKRPFKIYEQGSGKKPIIGTMAGESRLRHQKYMRDGCNAFDAKRQISSPISFWQESDIWEYINTKKLPYSKIYDMGRERTGCMFCLFGYHMELKSGVDRVDMLKQTHPKVYDYCMDKLGMREVLEWYPKKIDKDQTKMF